MPSSMQPSRIHAYTLDREGNFVPESPAAKESPYSNSDVINFLTQRLPHSVPILRRIQLGPRNDHTQLITTPLPLNTAGIDPEPTSEAPPGEIQSTEINPETVWTMVFVDRESHPATEVWTFSSLELYHGLAESDKAAQAADALPDSLVIPFTADICSVATSQLLAALSHIKVTSRQPGVGLLDQFGTFGSPCVLAGNVHSTVSALLDRAGLILRTSQPYGKYLFSARGNPQSLVDAPDGSSVGLPDGLQWSTIGPDDYADVMAANKIVRSAQTIAPLPSVAVREAAIREGSSRGRAVAFVFGGRDGTVRTLHVDPVWRRKGLAKAVVERLRDKGVLEPPVEGPLAAAVEIRERSEGPEPRAFAGIDKGNIGSIRTFQALGAKWQWDVYWIWLDLDRVAEKLALLV